MLSRLRRLAFALVVPSLLATACAGASAEDAESSANDLNYRSTAGQEFALSATVTFKIPEDAAALTGDAKQKAIAKRANDLRTSVMNDVSIELDRIWPESQRTSSTGVALQFRQASATFRDLEPSADGTSYSMVVSGEFAGSTETPQKLPLKTIDGKKFLPVSSDLGGGAEELAVFITPIARSSNAYPKYLELLEDGLDIGVHIGGDHNTPPKDISHARSVFTDLVASGFKAPVARFEDLKIDSGPLTTQINVNGERVDVRVRLYHPDLAPADARQPLVDAYTDSMKNADVVIYDGHAGRRLDYSGVVLAYNPSRVSVPADDFAKIDARSPDKQQIYLFNGCETYTGYGDKIYENPNRNPENTDVITTANYSAIYDDARQVLAFIHALVDQKSGAWVPRSWDSVLSRMNNAAERAWVHIYGVQGIDDDPKISPLADPSKVGQACTKDSDCGATDSVCLSRSLTSRVCAAACADTAGCPRDTQCMLPRGRTSADDLLCVSQ